MPLVLDGEGVSDEVLDRLVAEFDESLQELGARARAPAEPITNPGGLVAAAEICDAVRALQARLRPRSRTERIASANLGYAAMLAVIALVKSSTDTPRVPFHRPAAEPK